MKKTYIRQWTSLFLALILALVSPAFAALAEQPVQNHRALLTVSSVEIYEDYRTLVDANGSQITAEPVSYRAASYEAKPSTPEEYLQQNYNLMYQFARKTPDVVVVDEGIDENSIYRQIQYDKTTKSYLMLSVDTDNDYVSILIGDEEYTITLENDKLIMRLDGENPLVLCDYCSLFTAAAQEPTMQNYASKSASTWLEINRVTYRTALWVKILSASNTVLSAVNYRMNHPVLGTINLILTLALEVGASYVRDYEIDEIEYWRSDCVLYRRKFQEWYDIGSGTQSRYYVGTKDYTYWTEPPSGSGCMQYDYPGY